LNRLKVTFRPGRIFFSYKNICKKMAAIAAIFFITEMFRFSMYYVCFCNRFVKRKVI